MVNQGNVEDVIFDCGRCGHSQPLSTINAIRKRFAKTNGVDESEFESIEPSDHVQCLMCGSVMAQSCSEGIKVSDERQTWLRQIKKRFIDTLQKDPLILRYGIDPEVIWKSLENKMVFEFPTGLQYQKVNRG